VPSVAACATCAERLATPSGYKALATAKTIKQRLIAGESLEKIADQIRGQKLPPSQAPYFKAGSSPVRQTPLRPFA